MMKIIVRLTEQTASSLPQTSSPMKTLFCIRNPDGTVDPATDINEGARALQTSDRTIGKDTGGVGSLVS